jgi:zinc transporter ZupT
LIFIPGIKQRFKLPSLLSFSGSFLLSISFLHIFPELFQVHDINLGLYLMTGFFLQLILDYFSGGIEHGHTHVHSDKLGHFPVLVFFSLCLHAFLEAMPLEHFEEIEHEHALLIGLIVHKLPISFILASLLLAYQLKKSLIALGILLFSLSAPLGMWIGAELIVSQEVFSKLLAISAGIILHLSTTILLEGNEEHKVQWKKLLPMILGAGLALLSLL